MQDLTPRFPHEVAAGNAPAAIQARAGHADFPTTQRYLHLAGIVFRDEAERAEARILGELEAPAVEGQLQPPFHH